MSKYPHISLVLATIGRTHELARFLHSLDLQDARGIELVVVDQNPDDRLLPLLLQERAYIVKHIRADRGLSRARNVGLCHVSGAIVGFPDDDCWYPPGLIATVITWFEDNPHWDGLTGRSIDEDGAPSNARFAAARGQIDVEGVWTRGISYTIFLRRQLTKLVGQFDENIGLGAGTRFGSGEETDYLIRALRRNARVFYEPRISVFHPRAVIASDANLSGRARLYGGGMGYVLRKHKYPLRHLLRVLVRPIVAGAFYLVSFRVGKARYYLHTFMGRLDGITTVFDANER
ncbi:MAG: glycosyltransferase family 2 protein [Halobacteriota archaeon]